ncbi:50S ribosomal protein L23 [Candidatus Cerribacteria bacterium 'Amazon FNV 2010 28 9']|uniref:Large ribosomal subunit protein uL23 n=1 Tax=Candidatus Cerribacteria bacterium 'Amazon FNV 2010 28 9' TaxID=2081795 RepID=A0A317JPI0_9BACT|nr:MAG: 50S ribosomal protein L23 [Candidatus Cerribacteria bacterium 'Amazon FNV 2010 28 9']
MNAFILKKPVVTEKSYRLQMTSNEYTFEVERAATKGQIKEAVETMFNVKVLSVHTVTVAGKNKRTGRKRTTVRRPDRKKAIVRLAKDQKIELFDMGEVKAE